jgi:hypothetical protein
MTISLARNKQESCKVYYFERYRILQMTLYTKFYLKLVSLCAVRNSLKDFIPQI